MTLKQQFATVFANQKTLDYLMVGTFNEHIAQPQKNPYSQSVPSAIAMGLETDPQRSVVWVDLYGDGITRDLEPTVEDGGSMWSLFLSCSRVLQRGEGCTATSVNETCCDFTAPESSWTPVYSLSLKNTTFLLTPSLNEAQTLARQGWTEYCPPFGHGLAFCTPTPGKAVTSAEYALSPFLILSQPQQPVESTHREIVRCIVGPTSNPQHVFTASSDCLGLGKSEGTLGYVATTRSSEAPRSLRQCVDQSRASYPVYYTSLDAPCATHQVEYLGYVH